MRTFDKLALLGVITFTTAGFFMNTAAGRELAEVTLESPFGPGWMLGHHQDESELDNVHDPIQFGNCSTCGGNTGGGDNNDDEEDEDQPDDEEEEDDNQDDEEEEDGAVGSGVGGTGDENPFDVLEEMFQNMTDTLSDLEDRVAALTDLQSALEDLQDTHDELKDSIQEQLDRIDELEARIAELEDTHVQACLDDIKENGVYVSDRWRIFEGSNSDLLIRDTQTSNNPSYRFVSGGRDTFGDE
jgi:hypothetical protein